VGGRDGHEEPTGQLHTCLDEKAIEEIRDIVEWEEGGCMGTTSSGIVDLTAAVLTFAAALFFDFTAAGLGPSINLGSCF
jgi:hypothetical protein